MDKESYSVDQGYEVLREKKKTLQTIILHIPEEVWAFRSVLTGHTEQCDQVRRNRLLPNLLTHKAAGRDGATLQINWNPRI